MIRKENSEMTFFVKTFTKVWVLGYGLWDMGSKTHNS
jgi:hypothetical protein